MQRISRVSPHVVRPPAIVVAASDARQAVRDAADYPCDGTADDEVIQAAIDALPAAGGTVELTEGNYDIRAPVEIAQDNVELVGQGWATLWTLAAGVDDYMLKLLTTTGRRGVVVKHMKMGANKANQSAGGCIDALGARDCLFERLWLDDFYTYGLYLNGYSAGELSYHNHVGKNVVNDGPSGIYMYRSDENYVLKNTTGLCSVVAIRDDSGPNHISYNTIVGISGATGDGIQIQDTENSVITFNILDGVRNKGLVLVGADLVVQGNQIFNSGAGAANVHSAIHNRGDRNHFINNIVEGSDHKYAYDEDQLDPDDALLMGNRLGTGATGKVNLGAGTGRRWVANPNFVTENSGTATLLNGQTAIVVNHGLAVTPAAGDIMVTPIEGWGNALTFYIDTYTSTQFTIHVDQDPGADVDFAWKAMVV